MDRLALILGLVALVTTGAVAGLLFGYACSVMIALDRQAPETAVRVMQTINVVIVNPVFIATFLGALVAAPAAAGFAYLAGNGAAAGWFLLAFLAYGLGTFGVTTALNVPLNEALGRAGNPPSDPAAVWAGFAPAWNRWNVIRTAAGFLAVALCGLGLRAL
ncbi:anthrone oxygenase family protein [Phreatobacter sp.]|uniref:anthrone oxygenase family protein n=1 Tax=Phreatobacter sp. TaxID=1966341 RepID=UPI003F70E6A6